MYLHLVCQHCGRSAKSKNSNTQHEIRCKQNPNPCKIVPSYGMLGKKGANQYTKAKELGSTYFLKDSTRKKLSKANIKRGGLSQKTKDKLKISMANAVNRYPESYLYGNSHKAKRYYYNGVMCQGTWELDFYKWCLSQNIEVIRGTTSFEYEWNGSTRQYFPDFYLPNLDCWIEVKGFESERDRAKWKHFPQVLKVVREKEIKAIRNNQFGLVDLVGLEPTTLPL